MTILAFDTTLSACSVAVWRNGITLATHTVQEDRKQAKVLIPLIQQAMTEAHVEFSHLHAIGVTTGPGSFTGVRIGLAAARGFGLALQKPVIGISTFEALAASVDRSQLNNEELLVAIDSRRGDVFAQIYDQNLKPKGDPFTIVKDDEKQKRFDSTLKVIGDGASLLLPLLLKGAEQILPLQLPNPADIARLTAERIDRAAQYPARPLYLRNADIHPGALSQSNT